MSNSKKGFASMSKERNAEIARKGGKAAHAQGKAHKWTAESAKAAGSKGGKAAHAKGAAHQFTSEEARAAGKKSRGVPRSKNSVSDENKRLSSKLDA